MAEMYFTQKPSEDCASELLGKINSWSTNLNSTGYLDKLKQSWANYYGAYYNDLSNGHQISFAGEQGELVQLAINHYRNLASHMISLITQSRPVMDCRAINTDVKSINQAKLGNGILEYYLREKKLERYLQQAVEHAVVLGAGWIKAEWNATTGQIYDYMVGDDGEPDKSRPIYDGDIEFSNLSPFDVIVDGSKENNNHDWWTIRTFKNKYDLAAKYPEWADKIIALPTKSDLQRFSVGIGNLTDMTSDIPVYEFYHRKTDSVSEGRYMLFVDETIVLQDIGLPYRVVPIFRISAGDIMGTPYGYSPMFDAMPIQENLNSIYSTVATNQNAFGVQNMWMPPGAEGDVANMGGGLNVIRSEKKPESIQLCSTPKEIFDFIGMLKADMETLTSINSVVRGDPAASLRTGAALALVQSSALQFLSPLSRSYTELIEEIGTSIITILQDYAKTPRMVAIVGKSNKTALKEFQGTDIANICRVYVDEGNPLSKCLKIDTPVLMFDGSIKKVQDIKIGESVMGPDSKARTVSNVNSGQEMMYDIHHKNKRNEFIYGCNESHILSLRYCASDGRYGLKQYAEVDMSVKEFLSMSERQQNLFMGFRTGVEFTKKETTVPPYVLGLWLGDGNSNSPTLTSMDEELANIWSDYGKSLGLKIRTQDQPNNKSKVYFITSGEQYGASDRNQFTNYLREMDLLNNKHIPSNYLTSSREDRLQLLAGLIDTDGTRIDETFVISQKNKNLINNIEFLAGSLGFRVVKTDFTGTCSNNGVVGEYSRLSITGETWEIPTRLERKKSEKVERRFNHENYGIDIIPVGMGTYYGFTLKEEPHFVLGDFTVTHNTIAGRMELAQQMIQYQVIKNPNQIIQVLETGRLDALDEDVESELNLMRDENEVLMSGGTPQALAVDDHKQHIWEHRKPLQDTELRKDPDLVKRVLSHIQQHIDLLRDTDPQLLQLVMQQPLPPENPPGPPPGSPPQGGPPPQQGPQQGPPSPQGPPQQQHRPPGPPHSQGAMGHNMPRGLPMAFQPPTQGIMPAQPGIPPRR